MTANPVLLQMKYARVVQEFSKIAGISVDEALDFFYHSTTYQLIHEGVSDLHCMSDNYLAEELLDEFHKQDGTQKRIDIARSLFGSVPATLTVEEAKDQRYSGSKE